MFRGKFALLRMTIVFAILMGSITVVAQNSLDRTTLSLSRILWNERLKVFQSSNVDNGQATYIGNALSWDRTWATGRWGTGLSGMIAAGRTSAGDLSGTTAFADTGDRNFTLVGVTPRGFWRMTGQVQMGLSLPVIYRNADWKSENTAVTVQARRSLSTILGADLRVLLTPQWEFSQSLGILSSDAETWWQIGLHYRL